VAAHSGSDPAAALIRNACSSPTGPGTNVLGCGADLAVGTDDLS